MVQSWWGRLTPSIMRRRVHQVLLVLWVCSMVGSAAIIGGAAMDEYTIHKDSGRALATVTGVGRSRTTVDYRDERGVYHSPPDGLLYPTGLGKGQNVWVTYAKSNPDLVKVEGRGWTLSIVPALSVAVVATLVIVALWWWVSYLTRPKISAKATRR